MRIINLFLIAVFLLFGCAASSGIRKDKKLDEKPKIYKLDLDNDGTKEIIQVEDVIVTQGSTIVTIMTNTKDRKELDRINIKDFSEIEFIDLDRNGFKQIVIYTKDKENYYNLYIYSLKNKKLNEIFTISSPVGLDVNFKSCIPRIKAGIPKSEDGDNGPTYEVWVWSGYKFIKDHNE
ncbi:MAG: hypothetical protein AB1755_04950 [Candidatus Omnitrophota bacterium]